MLLTKKKAIAVIKKKVIAVTKPNRIIPSVLF